jgi:hypothetical protein
METALQPPPRAGSVASDRPCASTIDRKAVVSRHNVVYYKAHPDQLLQVGNGEIAFGVDVTGLQTSAGNTFSQWGWHSAPLPAGTRIADFKMAPYEVNGRSVGYPTDSRGQEALYQWLRENPHRMNLGRFSLKLSGEDGTEAGVHALQNVRQELDLWTGTITSSYELDGIPVVVETLCHPKLDAVAVRIESPLVSSGRLAVEFAFPYGDPGLDGARWDRPKAHVTTLKRIDENHAVLERRLDEDAYAVNLTWSRGADLEETGEHACRLRSSDERNDLEFVCLFSKAAGAVSLPTFSEAKNENTRHWEIFWEDGGFIELSESRDPRWRELERRIILSRYLLAVQESGSLPPQESGLYNNSAWWHGKFHLEMHWWHGAHYALWNQWPLFERSLNWYREILPQARALAATQGYAGVRWPKLVGPEGRDSPSTVGPLLVWQQPHPIVYAALDYRLHPNPETLEKWREIVFETADFMASYAVRDEQSGFYRLGPPLKTVSENTDPATSFNPTFELSYWRYGLKTAQTWRERMGLPRKPAWDDVLNHLAPLPSLDGCYLQQESMTDTFTQMNWEHPSLIGPSGMLFGDGVVPHVMHATILRVMKEWQWDKCWGWDFPMMAMAAARHNEPAIAVDALLHDATTNQFLLNGCATGGPYPYFPSNGGLLYAVAMMAGGWDGAPQRNAPGFPDNGDWVVRWENLNPAP